MDFLKWKIMNFDLNFTDICFYETSYQYSSIGLDNGLAIASMKSQMKCNKI